MGAPRLAELERFHELICPNASWLFELKLKGEGEIGRKRGEGASWLFNPKSITHYHVFQLSDITMRISDMIIL